MTDLQQRFAPDRRTDRVEVRISPTSSGPQLSGYTTVPAAARALDSLAAQWSGVSSSVALLPRAELTGEYGIIRTSVANIRTEPGHSQELTSQALLGTPIELLDARDGWYLIRTPDRYIAWLEEGAFVRTDRTGLTAWLSELSTCGLAQTDVWDTPERGRLVSELVAGCLVQRVGPPTGDYQLVRLPDDRRGYVRATDLKDYARLAQPGRVVVDSILQTAYQQVGRPYLWGGTSTKAMDCSGFTKTAYYLNGYVIPRDASQQVHAGVDVPLDDGLTALRRGDLLFFGSYRDDGSERVTHVGFYLGKGRFLHAGADNDYITENSLLEKDADFAPHRKESLLRARRLREGSPGVVPVGEAFERLYTRSSSR
ncbi:C40 family peptidase [Neolewinella maritima]|uniref:C40 family peptidase n=1 Tax=Neolewinella maritima TaxID=1383882 RepID=UPI001EE97395|nr:C40 family peptidase [Neolewinella maritima]